MEMVVPRTARGGITACNRCPPGSRASTQGTASSRRRPACAASRTASWRTAASPGNPTSQRSRPGTPVDPDLVGCVDQHVRDSRIAQERLQGPQTPQLVPQRANERGERHLIQHDPGRLHRTTQRSIVKRHPAAGRPGLPALVRPATARVGRRSRDELDDLSADPLQPPTGGPGQQLATFGELPGPAQPWHPDHRVGAELGNDLRPGEPALSPDGQDDARRPAVEDPSGREDSGDRRGRDQHKPVVWAESAVVVAAAQVEDCPRSLCAGRRQD